jgi:branched-chain amino acid aminotransferase
MLWYDGQLIESNSVSFDLSDRGLLLGDGLFETLPAFNGIPFLLRQHVDRMVRAAKRTAINVAAEALETAILELACADKAACTIRLTLTRGAGPRGLMPSKDAKPLIFATRSPWNPRLAFGAATLVTSTIRRNATSPASSMKTLSYLDHVLAFQEAQSKGADDALFLSLDEDVACTSMANLFILKGNQLITPPLDGSILPGITRQFVIDHAPSIGLQVIERGLKIDEALGSDGVFTTNSVRFLTRISALNGVTINANDPIIRRIVEVITAGIRVACDGFEIHPALMPR